MGIIRRFVNNPVAANMLMLLILFGGSAASLIIPREIFPRFDVDVITVTVPYPGASPQDIERGVCLKIEDYVADIEGIKEASSTSREGVGTVTLELQTGADVRRVLDDVKSEVDKITFPENAEDPIVRQVTHRIHVIHVAVSGDAPERTLKEIAEDIRDELNALDDVSQVTVAGVRDYEIAVEIDDGTLRRYGMTISDVAAAIRDSSFDLPAGRIKTQGGELALRIVGQKYTAAEFGRIPVLNQPDGTVLRLRDVADVREAFADQDIGGQFNGRPAALVSVYKTDEEDTLKIAEAVREYVAAKAPTLPEGVHLETWSDLSKFVRDRLDILIRNGLQGLVLVVAVLWLFLGLRLSFWIALGIPVSLAGSILVMTLTGQSLNMMSMFALIMALGLIVDDAIVVGENIYSHAERGEPPHAAAVQGAHQVMLPVIGAVATTWIAFIPLAFLSGVMGRFIRILPAAVIVALGFSLLECLTILPPHLAHSLSARRRRSEAGEGRRGRLAAARDRIDQRIRAFIAGPFARLSESATRNRYVTVALFVCVAIIVAGALGGGWIHIVPFPKGDSDMLTASIILPTGAPIERTGEITRQLADAMRKLNDQVETESGEPIIQRVYSLLGQQSRGDESGGHVGEVIVELLPVERRGETLSTAKLIAMWRKEAGVVPDALRLTFSGARHGPGGKGLEFRVRAASTDQASRIAERLLPRLADYAGVSDIEHDALPGKMELRITPRREAYASGLDARMLAAQVRDAFHGNESIEIQRGRDEIEVMVRYPQQRRQTLGDVETMRIRTPNGGEAPFTEVADIAFQRGYTTLRRIGGASVVTVSADIDEEVANAENILDDLQSKHVFDEVIAGAPGASIQMWGQRQQRTESLGSLRVYFPLALLGIYTVLAAIFRSYFQPIIIMVAIPFGLVGAVVGHALLGYPVTLLSLFGMVALTGIVVNDSLVLIDRVNRKVRDGAKIAEAVLAGARERFRAIVLTTVTTVAGMSPLLFERSFQAQFLKPMVVSVCFGLLFATILTLLAVPSLYLIGNDIRRGLHWLRTGLWPTREQVALREHEAA